MRDITGIWVNAYKEAPLLARVQILYMVVGMPVLFAGALVYLAGVAL